MNEIRQQSPCFDYRHFQHLGQIIANEQFADILLKELKNGEINHPMITSLCRDLSGDDDNPEYPASQDDYDPDYSFQYFHGKITITFNRTAARLIADSLDNANQKSRINPALWILHSEISKFYKKPSNVIANAAFNICRSADIKNDFVLIPREVYENLNTIIER
jgi:hypothetical protein